MEHVYKQYCSLLIFIGPKSDHCLACSLSHSVSFCLSWYDPGVWKFAQLLLALPAVVSFDSHVVDVGTKQKPRNWRRNKSHVVVVVFIGRRKQKPCCWCRNKQKPRCSCWRKTKAMLLMSEQNKCRIDIFAKRFSSYSDPRNLSKSRANKQLALLYRIWPCHRGEREWHFGNGNG